MIKSGSVCYLIGLRKSPCLNGRVVTVVAPCLMHDGRWMVDAEWQDRDSCTRPQHLLPINDPDEPITTNTPEELTA